MLAESYRIAHKILLRGYNWSLWYWFADPGSGVAHCTTPGSGKTLSDDEQPATGISVGLEK